MASQEARQAAIEKAVRIVRACPMLRRADAQSKVQASAKTETRHGDDRG